MLGFFKKKKHYYHVTIMFYNTTVRGHTYADVTVEIDKKINTKNDGIGKIKDYMRSKYDVEDLVILNIVKL